MAPEPPGWELYRTFLAVVREGSFSAAARQLDIAQPTVGRQIESLEAKLGRRLFTRSQRGLVATAAAREIVPHAEAMAAAAAALLRAASDEARSEGGTVRVTASEVMGHEVLPPLLASFGWRHPGIALELALSNRNEDLLRRDADVAVRMTRPTQQALVARRMGALRIGLYAHRRYVDRFGLPNAPDDLARHRMIGFDSDPSAFRTARGQTMRITRENFGFRCDSGPTQLAALRAGVGIAGCHVRIAESDPDLVRVLERQFHLGIDMWLVMHRDARATRRIRLVFDHLAAALADFVRA